MLLCPPYTWGQLQGNLFRDLLLLQNLVNKGNITNLLFTTKSFQIASHPGSGPLKQNAAKRILNRIHKKSSNQAGTCLDPLLQPQAGRTEAYSPSSFHQCPFGTRTAQQDHRQRGNPREPWCRHLCALKPLRAREGREERPTKLLDASASRGFLFVQSFALMFLSHPLPRMWNTSSVPSPHFPYKFAASPSAQKVVNGFISFSSCPQPLTSLQTVINKWPKRARQREMD